MDDLFMQPKLRQDIDMTCTEHYSDGLGAVVPEFYEGKAWTTGEIRELIDEEIPSSVEADFTPKLYSATDEHNFMKKWLSLTEQMVEQEHPENGVEVDFVGILKLVRDHYEHRWNFALDWQNKMLTINNAPTTISKNSVSGVYRAMLTLSSEEKAKKFVAEMLIDKLRPLFG